MLLLIRMIAQKTDMVQMMTQEEVMNWLLIKTNECIDYLIMCLWTLLLCVVYSVIKLFRVNMNSKLSDVLVGSKLLFFLIEFPVSHL